MNTPALITTRPIMRPQYGQAETFEVWIRINHLLAWDYWRALEETNGADPERVGAYIEFLDFAQTQFEVTSPSPQHARKSADSGAHEGLCADVRTADVGDLSRGA